MTRRVAVIIPVRRSSTIPYRPPYPSSASSSVSGASTPGSG